MKTVVATTDRWRGVRENGEAQHASRGAGRIVRGLGGVPFFYLWAAFFFSFGSAAFALGYAPTDLEVALRSVFVRHEDLQGSGFTTSSERATNTPTYIPAVAALVDVSPDRVDVSAGEERIVIPAISVDAVVVTPASTGITDMNAALLKGVVKYPKSAPPGGTGNLFLFGHSTGLKNIKNQNFAVFNGLKRLKAGDAIKIRSGGREYVYVVASVAIKPAVDAEIDLAVTERKLTLSTCRIYGTLEDRYIVEADFLRSYPLGGDSVAP